MAPKKRTMRDALSALDSDSSDDSEQEPGDKEDNLSGPTEEAKAQEQKRIRLETLERAGYSSGPSLLHIPKQPDEDVGVPSGWSTGKGESITERSPTAKERAEMREITAFGVAEEAAYAKRAMEHAAKLRQEHQKEKAEKAQKKKLTFKEKEKRKRDTGKQASDKNYVEEEKRIAREHGCYHGFDS